MPHYIVSGLKAALVAGFFLFLGSFLTRLFEHHSTPAVGECVQGDLDMGVEESPLLKVLPRCTDRSLNGHTYCITEGGLSVYNCTFEAEGDLTTHLEPLTHTDCWDPRTGALVMDHYLTGGTDMASLVCRVRSCDWYDQNSPYGGRLRIVFEQTEP